MKRRFEKFEISNDLNSGIVYDAPADFRAKLTAALESISPKLDQENTPHLLAAISKKMFMQIMQNERNLIKAIESFTSLQNPPYLLLKRFINLNNLPATPTDDSLPPLLQWRTAASALLGSLLISRHHAASFRDEMNGRLSHMVMPANHNQASYNRSTRLLNFHTEVLDGLFQEEVTSIGPALSPEVLGFVCLRNNSNIRTTLLPLNKLLENLPDKIIEIMMKPIFTLSSQAYSERKLVVPNVPLIRMLEKGYLGIRYNHNRLKASSAAGEYALNFIKNLIDSNISTTGIALAPGDILLVNNRACLHGRDSIIDSANFDGQDRWLIRMYGYHLKTLKKVQMCDTRRHVMVVDDCNY